MVGPESPRDTRLAGRRGHLGAQLPRLCAQPGPVLLRLAVLHGLRVLVRRGLPAGRAGSHGRFRGTVPHPDAGHRDDVRVGPRAAARRPACPLGTLHEPDRPVRSRGHPRPCQHRLHDRRHPRDDEALRQRRRTGDHRAREREPVHLRPHDRNAHRVAVSPLDRPGPHPRLALPADPALDAARADGTGDGHLGVHPAGDADHGGRVRHGLASRHAHHATAGGHHGCGPRSSWAPPRS